VGRECLKGIDTYLEEPSRGSFHCSLNSGLIFVTDFEELGASFTLGLGGLSWDKGELSMFESSCFLDTITGR
jgi:hypothetical protein